MNRRNVERIRELVAEIERLLHDDPQPEAHEPSEPPQDEGVGILGRPQYKMFGGRARWTAGLGIQMESGLQWINLIAWGSVAEEARRFAKGERVAVVGVTKFDSYVGNDGVVKPRVSVTVASICSAADVTSVAAD